jgi:hypothetical protein
MFKLFRLLLAIVVALIAIGLYREKERRPFYQTNASALEKHPREPRIPRNTTWFTCSRIIAKGRLVSIPDVHGDYDGLVAILRKLS